MRRLLTGAIVTAIMAAGMATPVSAGHDPTNACNGLDRANTQIAGSGTAAAVKLHDLRHANNCVHH
jgi:hypothetical protein